MLLCIALLGTEPNAEPGDSAGDQHPPQHRDHSGDPGRCTPQVPRPETTEGCRTDSEDEGEKQGDSDHHTDGDHPWFSAPAHNILGVDAALCVGEQHPTRGIQQQAGASEHRKYNEYAAHNDRVNSGTSREAACDTCEPAI